MEFKKSILSSSSVRAKSFIIFNAFSYLFYTRPRRALGSYQMGKDAN